MTLKEMLNEVLSEAGFLKRTAFYGSTDPDDLQMISIANRVAKRMRTFWDWTVLRQSYELTMIADTYVYQLPSNFSSWVRDSGWMSSGGRPVEIPVPDARWYMYKYSGTSDQTLIRVRLKGNTIELSSIEPGNSILFDYVSKNIVDDGGALRETFNSDNNTIILDDDTFILGVKAYWAKTKQFPMADDFMVEFMQQMNGDIGRAAGGATIGGGLLQAPRGAPNYPLWRSP